MPLDNMQYLSDYVSRRRRKQSNLESAPDSYMKPAPGVNVSPQTPNPLSTLQQQSGQTPGISSSLTTLAQAMGKGGVGNQGSTPLQDFWSKPVMGKMPLDQFVSLAGMLAGAIAPGTPQGRAGTAMSNLATQVYGQRLQQEMGQEDTALKRDLISAKIGYYERLGTSKDNARLDRIIRQNPETGEIEEGYLNKDTLDFTPIPGAVTPAERKKAMGEEAEAMPFGSGAGTIYDKRTGKPVYIRPPGTGKTPEDKEEAQKTKRLGGLKKDFFHQLDQHNSAARGVGQFIEDPNKERVAQESLQKAQTIAQQYVDEGGDPRDLGLIPQEEQTQAGGGNVMQEKPPASQHKGRVIIDTKTGKRQKSDGTKWVDID